MLVDGMRPGDGGRRVGTVRGVAEYGSLADALVAGFFHVAFDGLVQGDGKVLGEAGAAELQSAAVQLGRFELAELELRFETFDGVDNRIGGLLFKEDPVFAIDDRFGNAP